VPKDVPPPPSERRRREELARRRAIDIGKIPYDPRKMRPRTSWGCLFISILAIAGAFYLACRLFLWWIS